MPRTTVRPDRYRRQTQSRLFMGGVLLLLVVGGGLVWLFYGPSVALVAVLCFLAPAGLFGLLWLALVLIERWIKEDEP